eukprot:gene4724-6629_t
MSESCVIEVYENQIKSVLNGWVVNNDCPWSLKGTMEACKPPDEVTLPSNEWAWTSNWRIDKTAGITDDEGWEYASRLYRFRVKNRRNKPEKGIFDKARRRLWSRIMRREVGIGKSADLAKVMPKIQIGLSSIHEARVRIEEIMSKAPESVNNDQFQTLIQSVQKNIADLMTVLDQAEKQAQTQQQTNPTVAGRQQNSNFNAVIKKLRNDVLKEENAIERALYPGSDRSKSFSMARNASFSSNTSGKLTPRGSFDPYSSSAMVSDPQSLSMTPSRSYIDNRGKKFNNGRSFAENMEDSSYNSNNNSYKTGINANNSNNSSGKFVNGMDGVVSNTPLSLSGKSQVKGGSAKAFNPTINKSNLSGLLATTYENGEASEGMFMDRSAQTLLIEQKLVAIDEATVMQQIVDERNIEIEKVYKGLVEINEMFIDLSKIVKEQEAGIDDICANTETANIRVTEAYSQILEANRLQKTNSCIIS